MISDILIMIAFRLCLWLLLAVIHVRTVISHHRRRHHNSPSGQTNMIGSIELPVSERGIHLVRKWLAAQWQ